MKGEFTRFSFDKSKHVHQVLKQQGRVDLDADWNEQTAVEAYLRERGVADLIGQAGAPIEGGGFQLTPGGAADIGISAGRIYVDGILVENDSPTTFTAQPYLPLEGAEEAFAPPAIPDGATEDQWLRTDLLFLDVWQQHLTALDDPDIREVALGGPDTTTRLRTLWRVRVWDAGSAEACADEIAGFPPTPTGEGRLTTSLVDVDSEGNPCLIGPDTSGYRVLENRLYRVEIHTGGPLDTATFKYSPDNGAVVYAVESIKDDNTLVLERRGKDAYLNLAKNDWVELISIEDELRGKSGVLMEIDDVDDREITLTASIPTEYQTIPSPPTPLHAEGKWLKVRRWSDDAKPVGGAAKELVDPASTAEGLPFDSGLRVAFSAEAPREFRAGDYWTFAARTITGDIVDPLDDALPHGVQHHYAKLGLLKWYVRANRRLLRLPDGDTGYAPDLAVAWTDDGLRFTADSEAFWSWTFTLDEHAGHTPGEIVTAIGTNSSTITGYDNAEELPAAEGEPARVRINLLEANPMLLAEMAAIDLFTESAAQARYTIIDCRPLFPPLTELVNLYYVSGDGQEARPGDALPQPLIVRVGNGSRPVAGALVDFHVSLGGGAIQLDSGALIESTTDPGSGMVTHLVIATNADGFAQVTWQLDATNDSQQVTASLHADERLRVVFNANIDRPAEDEAGIQITRVFWRLADPVDAWHDRTAPALPIDRFREDLNIVCSAAVAAQSISRASCYMTIEDPLTVQNEFEQEVLAGYSSFVLAATVSVLVHEQGNLIQWQATPGAMILVQRALNTAIGLDERHVLARFTLKGNFIYQEGSPEIYLDGEAYGTPDGQELHNLRLPSGNGRRGGDFEMWFWITRGETPPQPPVASFTATQITGTLTVTFVDSSTSTAPIVERSWDFGDGTSLVTADLTFTHPFPSVGPWTVTLKVTDSNGLTDDEVQTLTLEALPVPENDIIRWVVDGTDDAFAPGMFDPITTAHTQNKTLIDLIYGGLVRLNGDGVPEGDLAESWEWSEDLMRVTFHLRDGLLFSDGNPITAEDVKFSLERALDVNIGGNLGPVYLFNIQEISVVDDLTVEIFVWQPSRFFEMQLTTPQAKIISRVQVESDDGWASHPVASGPFMLEETQQNIVGLARNDNYWLWAQSGFPAVTHIVMFYAHRIDEALSMYAGGFADIVGNLQNGIPFSVGGFGIDEEPLITDASCGLRFVGVNFPRMGAQEINVENGLLQQAMEFALDRNFITSGITDQMLGMPAFRLVPVPCINPPGLDMEERQFDPDRARALLDEAGFPVDEFGVRLRLRMAYANEGLNDKVVDVMAQFWRDVGIEVELNPFPLYEFGKLLQDMFVTPQEVDFHLYYSFWGADYHDPQNMLSQQLHSVRENPEFPFLAPHRYANNNGHYDNPDFDGFVDSGDALIPLDWEPYIPAERIAMEELPRIPIYNPFPRALIRSGVQGIFLSGDGLIIPDYAALAAP